MERSGTCGLQGIHLSILDLESTWCHHVLEDRKSARLNVRIVEDGAGRILAIMPFFEGGFAGPIARVTQFLGHRMSYHNDILLADSTSLELAADVSAMLLDDLGARMVLNLRHLDGSSPFVQQLVSKNVARPMCTRLQIHADSEGV